MLRASLWKYNIFWRQQCDNLWFSSTLFWLSSNKWSREISIILGWEVKASPESKKDLPVLQKMRHGSLYLSSLWLPLEKWLWVYINLQTDKNNKRQCHKRESRPVVMQSSQKSMLMNSETSPILFPKHYLSGSNGSFIFRSAKIFASVDRAVPPLPSKLAGNFCAQVT
jgi:hypothetical protein